MLLSGKDLADYIKQRHYQQVRGFSVPPRLAIIHASSDSATDSYLMAKQAYGEDIGASVDVHRPKPETAVIIQLIKKLNQDHSTTGIIVQLPLPDEVDTDAVLDSVDPVKDIDGLGTKSKFDPATPTGILWLLAGYNIDYKDKIVAVVGQGRLVGAPLSRMLKASGAKVIPLDEDSKDLREQVKSADIVITAAGQPDLITPAMVHSGQVIIDAGGDVDPEVQNLPDVKITPAIGGVGPMTVAALYDNLLHAVQAAI